MNRMNFPLPPKTWPDIFSSRSNCNTRLARSWFGNPTTPGPPMAKINEIFWSAQGEGLNLGISSIFIRMAGCSLRCPYCDTRGAWLAGSEMSAAGIAAAVDELQAATPGARLVISGGEPLEQDLAGTGEDSAPQTLFSGRGNERPAFSGPAVRLVDGRAQGCRRIPCASAALGAHQRDQAAGHAGPGHAVLKKIRRAKPGADHTPARAP